MANTMRGKRVTRRATRRRAAQREQSVAPLWTWGDAEKAGEYIDRPAETVRELARRGLLRGYKVKGTGNGAKSWRFKRDDLDAFIMGGVMNVAV